MALWLGTALSACGGIYEYEPLKMSALQLIGDRYTGAPAVVLAANDQLEYRAATPEENRGGVALTLTRYRRILILNSNGMSAAEVHLPFSGHMKLLAYDGRTTFTNKGSEERVTLEPKKQVRTESDPDGGTGEVIFTLPSAKPQAVIEYVAIYSIDDARFLGPLLLKDKYPVHREDVSVLAPPEMSIVTRYYEGGVEKPVKLDPIANPPRGLKGSRYTAMNLPAMLQEEMMPSPEITEGILWAMPKRYADQSQEKGWKELYKALMGRLQITKAPALVNMEQDKIQSAFVSQVQDRPVIESGLRLSDKTAKVGKDRIDAGLSLYESMLEKGFKVGLGLVSREEKSLFIADTPNAYVFDAVVAVYQTGGKRFYLDPSCPSCSAGQVSSAMDSASVVVFDGDNFRIDKLPTRSSQENASLINLNLKLDEQGRAPGNGKAILLGVPASHARRAYLKKDMVQLGQELLFQKSIRVEGAQSPDASVKSQTFEVDFNMAAAFDVDPNKQQVSVSTKAIFGDILKELWRESRTQKLLLPMAYSHEWNAVITLPPHAGPVGLPAPTQIKSTFGEYALQYKMDEENRLVITRRLTLKERSIAREDYELFYAFIGEARQADGEPLLIDLSGASAGKAKGGGKRKKSK